MNDGKYERELKTILIKRGYEVIRSAGSRDIDLFVIDPIKGISFKVEIKSSKDNVFYFDDAAKEQYKHLLKLNMAGPHLKGVMAFRWKQRASLIRWEFLYPASDVNEGTMSFERGNGMEISDVFPILRS